MLEFGTVIAEEPPAQVRSNPPVLDAYLGGGDEGNGGGDCTPVALFELGDFSVAYGGVEAVHQLALQVNEGEIVTVHRASSAPADHHAAVRRP